jgi:hypothetical protein
MAFFLFIPTIRDYPEQDAGEKIRDDGGDLALEYIPNFVK